ncbi:hypothetical protein ACEPPZ_19005 [Paracoccus yeei]
MLMVCLPLLLAVLQSPNPSLAQGDEPPAYTEGTFSGRLLAEIHSTASMIPHRNYGTATARFDALPDGRTRLTLSGTIKQEGNAGFSVTGRYGPAGFRSDDKAITLSIDPEGRITGDGIEDGQSYTLSGRISADELELQVQNRPVPETGATSVTGIDFTYSLTNDLAEPEGGTCKDIRYEMRPVASIGDGTMSMISVPVCLR